jgi:hypothetical protein
MTSSRSGEFSKVAFVLSSSPGLAGRAMVCAFSLVGVGLPVLCGRPKLQVLAVLRTARPVVEFRPLIAATRDWGGSVEGVHD